MTAENTRVDRFLFYLKNHRGWSWLVLLVMLIFALGQVAGSLSQIADTIEKLFPYFSNAATGRNPSLPVRSEAKTPVAAPVASVCRSSYQPPKTFGGCFEEPCTWAASGDELLMCDGQFGAVHTASGRAAIVRRAGSNMVAEELWNQGNQGSAEMSDFFQKYAAPGHRFRLLSDGGGVWAYDRVEISKPETH